MPRRATIVSLVLLLVALRVHAADVPSPEDHLGFAPGADFHLAHWQSVVEYFRQVDDASDRVLVRELGKTTEGRPYIVAIVSSAETLNQLDRYQDLQRQLADPRRTLALAGPDEIVPQSKPVVLITCSIHSSETASTHMAMDLLHELATGDDPATRERLDGTILLLVPSANPDGVDKVADWYERSKGTPWEGSGMPHLYHKYAGHDTNRDWFMLNLKETRLLTRLLYHEWFPTITYDVHQMGSQGARLFVPPFFDPVNPNLDPRIHQGIFLIGAHMAAELARSGKSGVLTNALYDNWWNGGNRTVPQRHNMVGVLTEAASVRLASPVFLSRDQLRGGGRGFPNHEPTVNFVDPWPGGWWHLRDIVDYELICARSLLTLAARYADQFQENYRDLALDAIEQGKSEPPYAWVVPAGQDDPGRAARMVGILRETGIEVLRASAPFRAEGQSFPEGSWILPASQPYRPHLKDMMERQDYPDRFTASGEAEHPYDVAGWTLPLQMGVRSVTIAAPFEARAEAVERVEPPSGGIDGPEPPDFYAIRNRANDDFVVLNALLKAGIAVDLVNANQTITLGGTDLPGGSLLIPADDRARAVLDDVLPGVSTRVLGLRGTLEASDASKTTRVRPQRIGLYQPWEPSMDEGWTRLVLEEYRVPFETLHNADLRAGGLNERIDCLLIPSIGPRTLREGFKEDETEPQYVGGLGQEGADAVREFVRRGGVLVCLEDSCTWAIDVLGLPVKDVLRGLNTATFYGPGSIVRLDYRPDRGHPTLLTLGMPEVGPAYFDRSLAFELNDPPPTTVVAARYAKSDVLESGWLLGPEKLQDQAALVDLPEGQGRVILFAFPPQHRGQTHATFRLLFNALLRGGTGPAS